MKIASWNVNSIRKGVKDTLSDYCSDIKPDIICFQETKCTGKDGESFFKNSDLTKIYPYRYWNDSIKGHHGVAVWSKIKPINIYNALPDMEHCKGRIVCLEFDDFTLLNTYVPNTGTGEEAEKRREQWHKGLLNWLTKRIKDEKLLIWCGDLNVVREPNLDTSHQIKRNKNNKNSYGGMKIFEYEQLCEYLDLGIHDVFRTFNPNIKSFTWFSTRNSNVGWRLDYFMTNKISSIQNIIHCDKPHSLSISDHTMLYIILT